LGYSGHGNNNNDSLKQAAGTAIGAAAEKVVEQNTEKFEAAIEGTAEFAETVVDKASKVVEQATESIETAQSNALEAEIVEEATKSSESKLSPTQIANAIKKIKELIHSTGLKMSKSVEKHFYELVKKGTFKGEYARPYMHEGMNLIIEEIMEACTPEKDQYLKNGLKWIAKGYFRGRDSVWELVIDLDKCEIVHFLFN
jgi:hypothetical protein